VLYFLEVKEGRREGRKEGGKEGRKEGRNPLLAFCFLNQIGKYVLVK
jgi:flagellar biosynthesis/type III secretory pathway protein FliH